MLALFSSFFFFFGKLKNMLRKDMHKDHVINANGTTYIFVLLVVQMCL